MFSETKIVLLKVPGASCQRCPLSFTLLSPQATDELREVPSRASPANLERVDKDSLIGRWDGSELLFLLPGPLGASRKPVNEAPVADEQCGIRQIHLDTKRLWGAW